MPRPETAVIIGDTAHLGAEFAQLALEDYQDIWILDRAAAHLRRWEQHTESQISTIHLRAGDEAELIWDEIQHHAPYPITLMVQIFALQEPSDNPWDEVDAPDMAFDFPFAFDCSTLISAHMAQHQGGEILNVVSRIEDASDVLHEMFESTREALLELSALTQAPQVHIHTLSYTPQSFALQSDFLPSDVAPDLIPETCAPREIAGYGYQVMRKSRSFGG
ncbi:MAG: hypothetical protein AAFW00_05025 [Bacteroidota bacterium]